MKRLLLAVSALSMAAASAHAADFDIVIRGGRVLDGGGNPWVRADVAIKDGRIVKVGQVVGAGAKEIDAHDRYVTPGFIDMMDQSGRVLLINGAAENKLLEGVTTVIAGEGGTPVPAAEITGYFDKLDKQGIAVNFGTYYAPIQARVKVMGDAAGTPTPAQLEAMGKEVDLAMRSGAFGIATALVYAPNSFQSTSDLIAMAKVASKCDAIYATHMRDEADKLVEAVNEAIEIGEKGGVKVEIFHLKAGYEPGWGQLMPKALKAIGEARDRGVDVAADMYVYTAGGTGLDATVPGWVWADGRQKAIERLRDPAVRQRLKGELVTGSPGWSNFVKAAGGWDHIVLAQGYSDKYKQFNGMSLAKIGAALHQDPADAAWDIWLEALPQRATALYFMMSEGDVELALRQPWVSIGSDSGAALKAGQLDVYALPHPRSNANFTRVIADYVEKRQILTLAEAVRKMTSWPAERMGLSDRGLVREGMRADVLVFDPKKVSEGATYERPLTLSSGIDEVIVNGVLTVDAGAVTGARAGRVLRHPCPSS